VKFNPNAVLIAVAVVIAGIIIAVWAGPESCSSWEKRSDKAFTDVLSGLSPRSTYNAVQAQRPAGC
jgi:hypothetical protein